MLRGQSLPPSRRWPRPPQRDLHSIAVEASGLVEVTAVHDAGHERNLDLGE
jgi:hypothetical protein